LNELASIHKMLHRHGLTAVLSHEQRLLAVNRCGRWSSYQQTNSIRVPKNDDCSDEAVETTCYHQEWLKGCPTLLLQRSTNPKIYQLQTQM